MMTQYSMDPVAKLGLLKMDFLGLTALTILDQTVKLLEETRGISIEIAGLPLDDPDTFELLSSGKTTECFQLESSGMQRYIRELGPSTIGDIAAMIALYRPGPMEHIDTFIDAKRGKIPITYPHDSLKDLLDETYGVIVYQDQVLFILQCFAGYSLGEADTVRKAMGKKIASLMAEEREKFTRGAQGQGFDQETATQIFDLIEPFAGYAFNKAHSVSYALISYWTAYFKTHHPQEYMAAVLNARGDHPERAVTAINECFRLGIRVTAPDINSSGELFCIDQGTGEQGSIRTGLAAIKNVTEAAVAPIVRERRENGPYESLEDFCRRADVSALNRRALENLIKAGALDQLGTRGGMLGAVDQIMSAAQAESRIRNSGQVSLFNAMGGDSQDSMDTIEVTREDASPKEKARWERELIGISLTSNPLLELASTDVGGAITSLDQFTEEMAGQPASVLGQLTSVRERYTKEREKFVVATLGLLGGPIEAIIWPRVLERMTENPKDWEESEIMLASGRLQDRGGQYSLSCEEIREYSPSDQPRAARPEPGEGKGQKARRPARSRSRAGKTAAAPEPEPTAAAPAGGAAPDGPAGTARRLREGGVVLMMTESGDGARDADLLRGAMLTLLDHPGPDPAHLDIRTPGGRVLMEMPMISARYCPELAEQLERILGPGSVSLESVPEAAATAAPETQQSAGRTE